MDHCWSVLLGDIPIRPFDEEDSNDEEVEINGGPVAAYRGARFRVIATQYSSIELKLIG